MTSRNLIGSPEAIWLPSVANAFNIFLLERFFDSIPADYIDAAPVGTRRTCHRRLRDGGGPDNRVLPHLPAQHHGGLTEGDIRG